MIANCFTFKDMIADNMHCIELPTVFSKIVVFDADTESRIRISHAIASLCVIAVEKGFCIPWLPLLCGGQLGGICIVNDAL